MNRRLRISMVTVLIMCHVFFINDDAGAESFTKVRKEVSTVSISAFVMFSALPLSEFDTGYYIEKNISCVSDYIREISPVLQKERKIRKNDDLEVLKLRKWRLKNHIICISGKKAEKDAEDFLSGLPLCMEWEGIPEPPLAEAEYSVKWVQKRPDSVIAPFVHLFCAHRFRAVSEISCFSKNHENVKKYHDLYSRHLNAALSSEYKRKSSGTGLINEKNSDRIKCIADDMKGVSHVYLECQ